jgi:hypothetical protein
MIASSEKFPYRFRKRGIARRASNVASAGPTE